MHHPVDLIEGTVMERDHAHADIDVWQEVIGCDPVENIPPFRRVDAAKQDIRRRNGLNGITIE
jgi:hypothetical protein